MFWKQMYGFFFFFNSTLYSLLEELFYAENVLHDLIKNNYSIICVCTFIFTQHQERRKQNVIKPNKILAQYIVQNLARVLFYFF